MSRYALNTSLDLQEFSSFAVHPTKELIKSPVCGEIEKVKSDKKNWLKKQILALKSDIV